jgi:hypothetical protein
MRAAFATGARMTARLRRRACRYFTRPILRILEPAKPPKRMGTAPLFKAVDRRCGEGEAFFTL